MHQSVGLCTNVCLFHVFPVFRVNQTLEDLHRGMFCWGESPFCRVTAVEKELINVERTVSAGDI